MCGCDVRGKDSKKLCAPLQAPQPLWISSEYAVARPTVGYSHLWPPGPSAVPGGWKKGSAAGLQTPPADPSFPPAHPYPTALLLSGPLLSGSRLGEIRESSAPQRARAGEPGAVLRPLPLGEAARGGGTPEPRPTAPSPSVCHLPPVSLSPRASIPGAGGGGGAADSAPPSWLLPRRLAASALALALGTPSQLPPPSPSFERRLPPSSGKAKMLHTPGHKSWGGRRPGEGGGSSNLGGGALRAWISVKGHLCPAPGSFGDPRFLPESRCPPLRRVSPVTRLYLGDRLELESLASPHAPPTPCTPPTPASGLSLHPPAWGPEPQGCGGGIYLSIQPSMWWEPAGSQRGAGPGGTAQ